MRIDPVLAELRRDLAPQQRAQRRLEAIRDAWRDGPGATILEELKRYGEGARLSDCPNLECAFSELARARELVDALCAPLLAGLARHPLGHVPLRHQYSPGLALLQLAAAGRAALSLLCYEASTAGAGRPTQTVCFTGGERSEICLAGAAEARIFEILREEPQRADIDCETIVLGAGDSLHFTGPRRAKIVDAPKGRLVVLRISRTEEQPESAREYRIANGELLHRASGDPAESRAEMAAAVLGAMGRTDALPALARLAGSGSEHLRWQAVRQALGLDSGAGFALLSEIATDPFDPLAAPAGALRASLIERHPEFAGGGDSCPA